MRMDRLSKTKQNPLNKNNFKKKTCFIQIINYIHTYSVNYVKKDFNIKLRFELTNI